MTTIIPKRPRGRPPIPPGERQESLTIRLPGELRDRAQVAADDEGVDLSEWVREAVEEKLGRRR
jgi:predicted HicB family RNase H-like nuclease